ncbi:hypothetical protein BDZ85DRAFT_284581 [Elsinoe ampelina]|uniref:Aminoglycoside phosphotransferase domain-containing protein n=1 Tax=Elsinoe ampelina TaxID=302913 RepID=A0A6A6G3P3_9PEZI|nr:hypothetical protein BDZ85DRAFT_284581 [Elsinoe ampelina]
MAGLLQTALSEASSIFGEPWIVVGELMRGHSNKIYRMQSDSGKEACVRIAVDAEAGRLACRGYKLLQSIRVQNPVLAAPTVHKVHVEYLLLDYVSGSPLGHWSKRLLTLAQRRRLLDGLAHFMFTLWTTEMDNEDQGPSYSDWLYDQVDKGLKRSLIQTNGRWGDPLHFLIRRNMVSDVAHGQEDHWSLVRHGDMNAWNVIVDGGNIQGIIDWDTARVVPAAAAVQHPLFIANVPGWLNDGCEEHEDFADDRRYLEDAMRELDGGSITAVRLASMLQTSRERQIFEMSLSNARINQEYVDRELRSFDADYQALSRHLNVFLECEPVMREHQSVQALRLQLMSASMTIIDDS